jgi:uncharacterized protein YfaP (DUF2135 family)
MPIFKFNFALPDSLDPQRRRKLKRNVAVATAAAAVAVYAATNPGRIRIRATDGTAPGATVATIVGTIEVARIDSVMVNVNGYGRPVTVTNGHFTSKVPLVNGLNTIQATAADAGALFNAGSNVIEITASIPEMDIWSELTWRGRGDIDLHLYLPNGEHVYYRNQTSRAGANLDVDNQVADGPEHIVMPKALPGRYRLTALYFEADIRPPRAVPWQLLLRLRGAAPRHFSGVLHNVGEEQDIFTFEVK